MPLGLGVRCPWARVFEHLVSTQCSGLGGLGNSGEVVVIVQPSFLSLSSTPDMT